MQRLANKKQTVSLFGAMQRHKASVEVKQVIGILCKLLTATGLQHVPAPETFRRAKFGEVNVVSVS